MSIEQAMGVYNDPQLAGLGTAQSQQVLNYLFDNAIKDDPRYIAMQRQDRKEFERRFLQQRPRALEGYVPQNEVEEALLNDTRPRDSRFREFLLGSPREYALETLAQDRSRESAFGLTGAFRKLAGEFSERAFERQGDELTQLDEVNPEVYRYAQVLAGESFNNRGLSQTEQKMQTIGNALSIVGDMVISHNLYGSVQSGGGLVTSSLYQSGPVRSMLNASRSANLGTRALGKLGVFATEALAEGLGYTGEELLASALTGDEIDPLAKTFVMGVALNAGGNLIGGVLQRAVGMAKGVFRFRGLRGDDILEDPVKAIQRYALGDDVVEADVINAMKAEGFDVKEIEALQRTRTRNREVLSSTDILRDQDKATAYVFNTHYDSNLQKTAKGWELSLYRGADIDPLTFKSLDELYQQFPKVQTAGWERLARESSQYFGDVKLKVVTNGQPTTVRLNRDSIVDNFVRHGEVDEVRIQQFLDEANIGKKAVKDPQFWSRADALDGDKIYVPERLSNLDESTRFAQKFFKATGTVSYDDIVSFVRKSGSSQDYSLRSLRQLASKQRLKVELLDGGQIKVGEEIFDDVNHGMAEMQARHPEASLIKQLGEKDIYVERLADRSISVRHGIDGAAVEYADFTELFRADPTSRLYGQIAESFKLVSPDQPFTTSYTIADGGMSKIKDMLNGYKERVTNVFKTATGDTVTFTPSSRKYVVEYGDSGIRAEFDELNKAKVATRRGIRTVEALSNAAELRGYRFIPTKTGYVLRGNGEEKVFRTYEALKNYLGKHDVLFNVREFTDTNEALIKQVNEQVVDGYDKVRADVEKQLGKKGQLAKWAETSTVVNSVRDFITPMRERIRQLGDIRSMEFFEKLSFSHRSYETQYNVFVDQTHRMFNGISMKENRDMFDVFSKELNRQNWQELLIQKGYDSDRVNVLINTMGEVRDTLDLLSGTFGINQDIYITDYSSRLADAPLDRLMTDQGIDHRSILDPHKVNTKDYNFYARNLRVEDYIKAREGSLKSMLEVYARAGFKEINMGETISEINNYVKSVERAGGDMRAPRILAEVKERAVGRLFNQDRIRKIVRRQEVNRRLVEQIEAGEGRFARLSAKQRAAAAQKALTRDPEFAISSAINASVMAFKLRLPLRNVSQIFTTTASTFGPEYVWHAMAEILPRGEEFYKEAMRKGILQSRSPKAMYDFLSWMTNTSRAGTTHFKNSDDYNRIVSMVTAQMKFDDGLRSLRNGEVDMDRFMEFTGAKLLSESDKLRFSELMEKGEFEGARTLMERRAVEWTQFDYSSINKPQGQTTAMGKLLGQYSTYSIGYWQLISRNLRNLDPLGKAVFLARLSANTAGVYYLYNELLGIEGMPMNPLGTLAFTGGPMLGSTARIYNTATNMNMSAGQKALQIATRDATSFYPYFGMARKSLQAIEAIVEQDYYNAAIYALGGTPVDR